MHLHLCFSVDFWFSHRSRCLGSGPVVISQVQIETLLILLLLHYNQVAKVFVVGDGSSAGASCFKVWCEKEARHRSWLKRVAAPAGTLDPWRPKKRHRVSAVKWMGCLDNQLRHGMGKDLAFFTWLDGSEVWLPSNWRRWPMLTGTIDQGSDGLSASNAMTHMKKINWFCFMDWSHGACNDLERGYKKQATTRSCCCSSLF